MGLSVTNCKSRRRVEMEGVPPATKMLNLQTLVQFRRRNNIYYTYILTYMARATNYMKAQGTQLVVDDKITELVEGILYEVQSSNAPHSYFVYYGTPRACTCDGYRYRSICSHIKGVGLFRGAVQ